MSTTQPTPKIADQHTDILPVGAQAPEITLRGVLAGGKWETISLQQSLSQGRNAVVVFFPLAFSPGCTTQIPDYSNLRSEFAALDTDIYAISRESPYTLREWTRKLGLKVPLLSDMTLETAQQYGVALPHRGVCRRSVFAIDAGQTVRFAFAEEDSSNYTLEAEDMLEWLKIHPM